MAHSILDKASKVAIRRTPFPYLELRDALDEDYYRALAESFPSLDFVAGRGPLENNRIYLRGAAEVLDNPEVAKIWRDFFAFHTSRQFYRQVIAKWGDEIRATQRGIEEDFGKPLEELDIALRQTGRRENESNYAHDLMLDCVFGVNSPVRVSTPARGPHVDGSQKLFSALLYFRDPEDDCTGGEFELYRVRGRMYPPSKKKKIPRRYLERVGTVPYRRNSLVMWLNGAESIHAVSPRSVTPRPRRYVAVTGESYGGGTAARVFTHHELWERPLPRLRARLGV